MGDTEAGVACNRSKRLWPPPLLCDGTRLLEAAESGPPRPSRSDSVDMTDARAWQQRRQRKNKNKAG